MISPARVAAYDILSAVSAGRADLATAVALVRARLASDRDRALATNIAAGVERWRATLDHLIVVFSKRSIDRLDPEVVDILRLGAYQLLHLTRVPAAAVVDDAVDLVGRAGKRSASGLVNALLRTISRRRQSLPLPERPADPGDRTAALDYLNITLSHPRWLAARWLDRLGFEATEAWLRFNNTPVSLTLRVNRLWATPTDVTRQLAAQGIHVRPGQFAPDALVVDKGRPLDTSLDGRLFVAQGEASQLVALLAGSNPGPRVLDACASPGGKTTALAAAMGNLGLLVASDIRGRRMELLNRTVAASGATNIRLVQADLLRPLPFSQPFDCVLVDAPCSGLGILRSDPDIRWRRQEAELITFADTQRQMLQHAAERTDRGGRLIYATCSSEPDENERVVDAFLQGARDFVALDARTAAPDLPSAVVDARGHLRTLPHVHGLDAFFGAVLQRRP
ncbi:MAG: 16S rRNA (cytosine(967)-C(5))-methyltransferase [Acidobacteria bacterium RIFCSPLOWO2_12_FULL_65_11]|nr:MAG: 16S rRNA (cytosine(967)-C(5))-methyltransferase [Acidobacteria bacterium RIFCSPLOWO2_02_FULL_64_15]OFW33181.1 MAG: 16S rRNA (cytosine(967)-C(5))-methyltransferase [Acidobacteria bacterium RIFCSPLOWO2_12_FULL_65_11]